MNELEQAIVEKRGPGRPPKTNEVLMKKGAKSWTPSNLGDLLNKEPGFRYRWVRNEPDNIAKKEAEGWQFVNGTTDPKTATFLSSSRLDEPKQLTSNPTRRDAIAMRLDDDGEDSTAKQRDRYHNDKVNRLEKRLFAGTKQDLATEAGAPIHGNLTKEHKGVRTVIE